MQSQPGPVHGVPFPLAHGVSYKGMRGASGIPKQSGSSHYGNYTPGGRQRLEPGLFRRAGIRACPQSRERTLVYGRSYLRGQVSNHEYDKGLISNFRSITMASQASSHLKALTAIVLFLGQLGPVTSTAHAAPRSQVIESPPTGLPNQQFQTVNFPTPLNTSLVTVANRGGTGNRAFLVSISLSGGGSFSFQAKEGQSDITLPLSHLLPVTGVSIRCDSFSSSVPCRYTVSLVGE